MSGSAAAAPLPRSRPALVASAERGLAAVARSRFSPELLPLHRVPTSPFSRLLLPALAALLALPLLPGCTSAPAEPAGVAGAADDRAVRVAGLDPVALRKMGFTTRWISVVRPLQTGGITSASVFEDHVALVEGPDNLITVLDWGDGGQRWKKIVGLKSEDLHEPAYLDGVLLVNSTGRLFELDAATGDLTGVDTLAQSVNGGGVLFNETLVFGGLGGRLFGHSLVSGHTAWEYQMAGKMSVPPVRVENAVFAGDILGTYGLFNAIDGSLVWRNRVFGAISASAAVLGDDVLIPSEGRSLYALDRNSGEESWVHRADHPLRNPPHAVGDTVYLDNPDAGLLALDTEGREKWSIPGSPTPLVQTGEGVASTIADGLILLDPEDGRVLAATRTGAIEQATATADGSLLLVFEDGRVVRLDPAG